LIAGVSFITGAEVYLASKILTVLTLAGIFGILYLQFKEKAWVYALIMLGYISFLRVFYFSWTEQLFLFGSLWLVFQLIAIVKKDNPNPYHYLNVLLACLLMFSVRYVGLQSVGIIGVVIIYLFTQQVIAKKNNLQKIVPLFLICIVVSAAILSFFYMNYVNTGSLSGSGAIRGSARNFVHIAKSAIHLGLGQIRELSYIFQLNAIISASLVVLLTFIAWRSRKNFKIEQLPDSLIFFAMSIFNILAFLFFRTTTEVDQHYERHLLVPTILFAFGCIKLFFESRNDAVLKLKQFAQKNRILVVCLLFAWFAYLPARQGAGSIRNILRGTSVSYQQMRSEILSDVSSVPSKSVIIVGIHDQPLEFVKFMRPDVLTMLILHTEAHSHLLDINENVFLYLSEDWGNHIRYSELEKAIISNNPLLKNHISNRETRLIKLR
jgi:hypothetical protein